MTSRRLADQGEERNDKTFRKVGVLAEMRTGHLSKINQESYLWVRCFDKTPTAKRMKLIRQSGVLLQKIWRHNGEMEANV